MIGPVSVRVRDYLIVGMGDLVGVGVSNPDVPAQLDTGRPERKFINCRRLSRPA